MQQYRTKHSCSLQELTTVHQSVFSLKAVKIATYRVKCDSRFVFALHNIAIFSPKIKLKMVWKEQKLKTLEPPENAATVESIFGQIITSIFISELIQVNGLHLCGRGMQLDGMFGFA